MGRSWVSLVLACALAAPAVAGLESLTPAATPTPAARVSVGAAFDSLMPAYDACRAALSADSLSDLAQPARDLRQQVARLAGGLGAEGAGVPAEKLGAVRDQLPALRKATEALVAAGTLPAARDAFADLSKALVAWRRLAGKGPEVDYCPLAGQSWLQPPGTPIENPYLGKSMADCGERETP